MGKKNRTLDKCSNCGLYTTSVEHVSQGQYRKPGKGGTLLVVTKTKALCKACRKS